MDADVSAPTATGAAAPTSDACGHGECCEPRWLDPEEEDAWLAVAMLMFQLPGRLDTQLQHDSKLSLYEYLVLSSLSMRSGGTARMSELAKLTNGSLSRLSNVAKRLEDRGWLVRDTDSRDGRYTVARLTPLGRELVVAAAPGHVEAVRQLVIDPLTRTQIRALADIGRRLSAAGDF